MESQSAKEVVSVSSRQVVAFRLAKHRLSAKAPRAALTSVPGEIGGAQAQLLSAGQTSIGIRVRGSKLTDLSTALWKDRTLVKAWCMRRTMFLIPSAELALFARGSALRAEREMRWVRGKGVPEAKLEKLVGAVLEAMEEPITATNLAVAVSKSMGYPLKYKVGGVGWGNRSRVPWVDVGQLALPASYLLHLAGSRGVYCSGPNNGNESTFVRADKWLPHWKDVQQSDAERRLLARYLGANGPSTISDFIIWTGMTAGDAARVWAELADDTVQVNADGLKGSVLRDDVDKLEGADVGGPVVRLLPFFDSFLLGHRSHGNIVGPEEHSQVYRKAGWVSQVLLVDGRAAGVWAQEKTDRGLEIKVRPFAHLSPKIAAMVRDEADELGSFLGFQDVKTKIA